MNKKKTILIVISIIVIWITAGVGIIKLLNKNTVKPISAEEELKDKIHSMRPIIESKFKKEKTHIDEMAILELYYPITNVTNKDIIELCEYEKMRFLRDRDFYEVDHMHLALFDKQENVSIPPYPITAEYGDSELQFHIKAYYNYYHKNRKGELKIYTENRMGSVLDKRIL